MFYTSILDVYNLNYRIHSLQFNHLFISLKSMKDRRHKTVKILIGAKDITTFAEIFEHIPKTTVAEELGIHFNRMTRMIRNVNDIKINDVFLFSGYFEIESTVIFELISNQRGNKSAPKKRA